MRDGPDEPIRSAVAETASSGATSVPSRRVRAWHRRFRNAVVGAALLLAAASVSLALGWHGLAASQRERIPTDLLIRMVPREPNADGPLANELNRRMVRGRVDDDQLARLLSVCVDGDGFVEVGGEEWHRRYGRLMRLWRHPVGRPVEERERLFAIPAQIAVSAPPVWPVDAPIPLHLRMREWWPIETVARLRVEVPGVDRPITVVRAPGNAGLRPFVVELPTPPNGVDAVTLQVRIDRLLGSPETAPAGDHDRDRREEWEFVHSTAVSVNVALRARLADAMRPFVDPRLDEAMRSVFSNGLLRWRQGEGRVAIQFTPQAMIDRVPDDFAIGVEVSVEERGVTRRRSRLWWLVADGRASTAEWDPPDEDAEAIARLLEYEADDPRLGDWRVVIVSRPELALRAYGSSEGTARLMALPARYWDGRIEMPLRIRDRNDTPPTRSWRVVPVTDEDHGRLHDGG